MANNCLRIGHKVYAITNSNCKGPPRKPLWESVSDYESHVCFEDFFWEECQVVLYSKNPAVKIFPSSALCVYTVNI